MTVRQEVTEEFVKLLASDRPHKLYLTRGEIVDLQTIPTVVVFGDPRATFTTYLGIQIEVITPPTVRSEG